jgi:hypothetical protein
MTDEELRERLDRIENKSGGDGCLTIILCVIVALLIAKGCNIL